MLCPNTHVLETGFRLLRLLNFVFSNSPRFLKSITLI